MGKVIRFPEMNVDTRIETLEQEMEDYEKTLAMTEKILDDVRKKLEAEIASRAKQGSLGISNSSATGHKE